MQNKSRWMTWVLADSADLEIAMPWERGVRRAKLQARLRTAA